MNLSLLPPSPKALHRCTPPHSPPQAVVASTLLPNRFFVGAELAASHVATSSAPTSDSAPRRPSVTPQSLPRCSPVVEDRPVLAAPMAGLKRPSYHERQHSSLQPRMNEPGRCKASLLPNVPHTHHTPHHIVRLARGPRGLETCGPPVFGLAERGVVRHPCGACPAGAMGHSRRRSPCTSRHLPAATAAPLGLPRATPRAPRATEAAPGGERANDEPGISSPVRLFAALGR